MRRRRGAAPLPFGFVPGCSTPGESSTASTSSPSSRSAAWREVPADGFAFFEGRQRSAVVFRDNKAGSDSIADSASKRRKRVLVLSKELTLRAIRNDSG